MFIPSNVPLLLLPALVVIEIISHLAKMFSLAIRLFANMMSGHVLLHILTGFVLDLAKKNFLFIIFPTILIILIILLEYGITVLQAYVFATLLAIYFEEHFGFAQEDQNDIILIIYINGKKASAIRQIRFIKRTIITFQEERDFLFKRRTRAFTRKSRQSRDRAWVYTILSSVNSRRTLKHLYNYNQAFHDLP